nr:response regulator transcription factor [Amycolatopsis australiensis]
MLVEPDARTAGELGRALARHGIPDVRGASPDELFDRLDGVEVVVLDLGAAPRSESVRLCLRIRAVSDAGVILTSAGGDARDRVQALQAGADDYLVKPYGVDELADRITAVGLRRRWKVAARGEPGDVVRFGDVEVDLNRHVVSSGGRPVPLTRREFRVLAVLAEAGGEVRTRERLLTEVWGASGAAESRSLDAHIAALRRKLGDPSVIEAVGEAGYRLVAPPPVSPWPSGPGAGR